MLLARPAVLPAAEATNRYTLGDCLRIGLERATVLANARRDEAIALATVAQARAEALPHLAVRGSYTRLDEVQTVEFGGETIPLGSLNSYAVSAEATQLLFSGGRVNAALRAARLSTAYASLAAEDARAALIRDIQTGFYGILLAQSAVEVQQAAVAQLAGLAAEAERKQQAGTISAFERLSAQVRLANEKPLLVQARNRLEVAREQFRSLLNLEGGPYAIEGELACEAPDVGLDALQAGAVAGRPALRQMAAAVQLKEQDLAAARAAYWPSVEATAAYGGQSGTAFVSTGGELIWNLSGTVSARWNLWDGGLRRGTVRRKELELETGRANLEEMKKLVLLEVRQAYLDMTAARESVAGGRENVALAEEGLRIARTRFDTGQSTYLEFTDSNLACRTARLNLSQALHAHCVAVARLRCAVGLKEGESLRETSP
jgi:outer membrane protein